jgi:hypothetical protein
MTDIDWSKAPEGYPVWSESFLAMRVGQGWHAECEDRWVDQGGAYWFKSAQDLGSYKVHRRPTTQPAAWNGEGLPPIGTGCERNVSRSSWCQSKIFAHSPCGRFAAFLDSCGMNWAGADSFRPIRTPEQIAAEKREAAVAAMLDLDPFQPSATLGMMSRTEFCGALYDAGYRKQEQAQ